MARWRSPARWARQCGRAAGYSAKAAHAAYGEVRAVKVLIYGLNFRPELTGIGKYSGDMADWLAAQGHAVRVVTAPPYYPDWRIADGVPRGFHTEGDNPRVYRCPLYVPAQPATLTRLLHLLSFALTSWLVLVRLLRWRPDVLVMVEPTLFCAPGALLYAKLTGAKAVLHVQDYEVDAMFGLGLMARGRLARWVANLEAWVMRRFDRVSTISHSMMQHAQRKGVSAENILFFPNWVDTDFIRPDVDRQRFRTRWNIADSTRVVLYSGNMGRKQGLEMVLAAAARWRERHDVLFVMVGQGAACEELKQQARQAALANVRFEPLQPYGELPNLLALADVHLVVQKRGAADVVLPSKLTGILSAGGHVLITAEADTELGLLTARFPGIARRVEPESLDDFCTGLAQLLAQDTRVVNQIARHYALQFLNQDTVLGRFATDLQSLCESTKKGLTY